MLATPEGFDRERLEQQFAAGVPEAMRGALDWDVSLAAVSGGYRASGFGDVGRAAVAGDGGAEVVAARRAASRRRASRATASALGPGTASTARRRTRRGTRRRGGRRPVPATTGRARASPAAVRRARSGVSRSSGVSAQPAPPSSR